MVQAKRLRDFRGEGEQAKERAEAFLHFWRSEIVQHFRDEEEVLLPLIARHEGSDCAEITETLHQHVRLRMAVMELAGLLDGGKIPDAPLLNTLGDELRNHVRFEEDELFPFAEAVLDEGDERYLLANLSGN